MKSETSNQTHSKATFAIYKTMDEIKVALKLLKNVGFAESKFSFFKAMDGAQDFPQIQNRQLKNGTVVGAILGIFIIGGLFLFIGSRVLPSSADGSEFSLVASILMVTACVTLGGFAGAACGMLVGIGTPDPAGKRFGQYMHEGGILLSVESKSLDEEENAAAMLKATGGQEVHVADERETWNAALDENLKLIQIDLQEETQRNERAENFSPEPGAATNTAIHPQQNKVQDYKTIPVY